MEHLKGLLKSKVFWFNVASVLLEISGYLIGVIPQGTTLIAVNIINILLRTVTTKSLSEK